MCLSPLLQFQEFEKMAKNPVPEIQRTLSSLKKRTYYFLHLFLTIMESQLSLNADAIVIEIF